MYIIRLFKLVLKLGCLTDIKKEKAWIWYASAGHVKTQNKVPNYIINMMTREIEKCLFADI